MLYALRITRKSDAGNSRTEAKAEGRFEGGALILNYSSDGADNVLTLSANKITHERFGEIALKMEFDPSQPTSCRICGCGSQGGFEIITHELKVKLSLSGSRAKCVYSGGDGERTQISISVSPAQNQV